ncbi:MAG TPA: hypothetical protein VMJ90_08780 [Anaerolineales bacterium]|nr:hypothetical protein [Anaerolineales bacterium]
MVFGDFFGRKTVILENEFFRIECLADAGPRIVRLIPVWTGENLFAELPNATTKSPHGEYHFYGGHRLWRAPESPNRTYIPDDTGVTIKEVQNGIKLSGAEEPGTGLRKAITIQMSSSQPFIIVKHKIENLGSSVVRLAPWAITMLRPNGTALLPQQVGNLDDDGVLPNRRFALWPYSRWDDSRLRLGDDFVTVSADGIANPLKIGYFNPHGWLGYVYFDVMFVKRFGVRRDEDYPDVGCNAEVYVNARALELESLGPSVELAPQVDVVHTETWEVYDTNKIPTDLLRGKPLNEIIQR